MSDSILQKAQLVPVDPSSKQALMDQAITVHFKPESLKLTYTVTVKADTGSKNSSDQSAQQSSSSSAKLAVDLVKGQKPAFNSQYDNGKKKVDTVLLQPILLTKKNVDVVVKDGFYTQAQLSGQ